MHSFAIVGRILSSVSTSDQGPGIPVDLVEVLSDGKTDYVVTIHGRFIEGQRVAVLPPGQIAGISYSVQVIE
jgi:hypothetical protein